MTGTWAPTWSRLKGSFREWAVILTGLVIAQGLNALALIVVARRVPPSEFGQYVASYSLASLLVVPPALGMDAWLLAQGATQPGEIQTLWRSALRIRSRLLMLWLLAMFGLALGLPAGTFPIALFALSAVGLAAESLTSLAYASLRNIHRHKWVTAFQAVGAITLFCGALALPLGAGQIARFAVFRTVAAAALAMTVIRWMARSCGRSTQMLPTRTVLQAARAFMLADVAVAIYLRADLTIVGFILGSDGASIYGPALNLANMCFLVPSALYFLALPTLASSRRHSLENFDRFGRLQLLGQLLSGFLLSVAIFVLAEPIVHIVYGSDYAPSAAVLRLLSPMLAIKSVNFGLGALLTAAGLQARRTTFQVLVALFNGCANLAAVSVWGVMGAAAVYVLSEALLCTGYLWTFLKWRRSSLPEVVTAL